MKPSGIQELVRKHKNEPYFQNTLLFICKKCNYETKATFYEILRKGEFEIREPVMTYDYFIREYAYEEMMRGNSYSI